VDDHERRDVVERGRDGGGDGHLQHTASLLLEEVEHWQQDGRELVRAQTTEVGGRDGGDDGALLVDHRRRHDGVLLERAEGLERRERARDDDDRQLVGRVDEVQLGERLLGGPTRCAPRAGRPPAPRPSGRA